MELLGGGRSLLVVTTRGCRQGRAVVQPILVDAIVSCRVIDGDHHDVIPCICAGSMLSPPSS